MIDPVQIGNATLYLGDCLDVLSGLPSASVQCCVTSPPYFGLRDYGHEDQIGLEPTPDEYVTKMVSVFREVRRVLRDDGTLWLNIGDSYNAAGRTSQGTRIGYKQGTNRASAEGVDNCRPSVDWLKPKDLIGIPWMLSFALRADGWYLRQDIIWHKPNPMPESVRDRCTKAHEYLFLLSKAERYFYDSEAIKEDALKGAARSSFNTGKTATHQMGRSSDVERVEDGKRNRRSVWTVATQPYSGAHFATFPPALIEPCILAGSAPGDTILDPFSGSGTTAAVATRLGRKAIGIELNADYQALAVDRISQAQLQPNLFHTAEAA
jgi:site-specific DNA-methyltransferase (adenine-specific)